jgi:cell division protein FtsQ
MIRKIVKILLIIPVLYMIMIPFFFATSAISGPCTKILINITDSSDYHFVTKGHLMNMVYGTSSKILGRPLREVPVTDIEKRIKTIKELKEVEVYTAIDGTLHVYVNQRNPMMRIIPDEGGDFFVDEDGFMFRKRNLYNPRLHIIEGNIDITPAMLDNVSILDTIVMGTILKDIYHFVDFIRGNSFWSAQIDQIYVNRENEIDLIPRVGNHTIHMGTFEDYKDKLRNLKAFYEKVLPEVGWDKYSVINLEFGDQIVCRRR